MRLVGKTSGDVERIGIAGTCGRLVAFAEDDLPERRVGKGLAGGIGELSDEGEGGGVVDVDDAVAEVADEQVATEDAEASGSDGYAPGSVEVAAGDGAGDEVAVEVKDIDDTIAGADGLDIACSSGSRRSAGDVANGLIVLTGAGSVEQGWWE